MLHYDDDVNDDVDDDDDDVVDNDDVVDDNDVDDDDNDDVGGAVQGYGMHKDEEHLWGMEVDRERGGLAPHHHQPAAAAPPPLGWGLEASQPPHGALAVPQPTGLHPPHPPQTVAGHPNGHPPPGNLEIPATTGHLMDQEQVGKF